MGGTESKDFGYQQESESPTKKRKIQANTDEMAAPEQFEGFMIHDTKNWTKFSKEKFLLRPSKIMMSISRTNAAVSAVQMFIRLQEDGENWPQHQSASVTKSSERY